MRVFSRLCRLVTLLTLVPTNLLMIRVLCVFCHKPSEASGSFGVPVLFRSDNQWSVLLHSHYGFPVKLEEILGLRLCHEVCEHFESWALLDLANLVLTP